MLLECYFKVAIPALLVIFFLAAKNDVTYLNDEKIIDAIHIYIKNELYNTDASFYELSQIYDHMRPYYNSFWRLWDWGYKHILPEDDYEKIKKYIK